MWIFFSSINSLYQLADVWDTQLSNHPQLFLAWLPILLFIQLILKHLFCTIEYMPSDFLNLGLEQ